jgi:adenylate cyclase
MAIDYEKEGLLKGVRGKARQARRELLDYLIAQGVGLDELKEAAAEDRLAMLPVESTLAGGDARCTGLEIAERSGLDVELLLGLRQSLGLPRPDPEDRVFTEDDVKAAEIARQFREAGLPPQEMLEVARVIGMTMSQLAEANRSLFRRVLMRPGDTERDLGLRFAEAAKSMMPLVGELLMYALKMHQLEQIRNDAIGQAEAEAGALPGSTEIAVCFADMVGFTKLGESLPPDEIGLLAGRLGEMASAVARPPVRLIKMIGDAAMLVCPQPQPLIDAALDLVEQAEGAGEGFPPLRAGVAWGPALNRFGDWYGPPVNLASRITAIALPGSVLVSPELAELPAIAEDGYRFSRTRRRHIKGVGEMPLLRVRRSDAPVD